MAPYRTSRSLLLLAIVGFAATLPVALGIRQLSQTSSNAAPVEWDDPDDDDTRLTDRSVPVGGSLTLRWNEDDDDDDDNHDVWEISSLTCPQTFANGTGITQLAPAARTGELTIAFPDAGVRYFTSSVDDDCKEEEGADLAGEKVKHSSTPAGLLLAVSVGDTPVPSPYTANGDDGNDDDGEDEEDDKK